MTTALILGVTGQDGSYLTDLLLARGYHVVGVARHAPRHGLPEGVEPRLGDSRSSDFVSRLVAEVKPAEIYHLAAQSSVARSWSEEPGEAAGAAEGGASLLLDAAARHAPAARVVLSSSSEVFGGSTVSPQNEDTPLAPVSPYGRGKARVLAAAKSARVMTGLHASAAILFSHESPRRPPHFLSRKVTRAAAAIAAGRERELRVGNMTAVRDWGFAGDYVDALWRMAQAPSPDDYVIGTGVPHTAGDLCRVAFAELSLDYRDFVVSDPALFRPMDPVALVADPSLARTRLGWSASTSFEDTIREMVRADVGRLRRGEE